MSETAPASGAGPDAQEAPAGAAPTRSARPAPGAASPPVPPTESEIDSPSRLTLGLLSVVFLTTSLAWGSARFACNMHPPESRAAPKLPTERLIQTPKDAAIEFVQRYRSSDFAGALEIATGDLIPEVERAKAACDARAMECAREREASAGRLSTAIVEKLEAFRAAVRVTTELGGQREVLLLELRRIEGMAWRIASVRPG